jgi:serine protease Do
VTEVQPESHAAKAGIIKGDTLIGLHQWEMLTIDNLVFVLNHNELPALNPIKFFVLRGGQLHRGLVHCLSGQ